MYIVLYMPAKRVILENLFELKGQAKKENKQYVKEVIDLYKARKIEQPAAAIRIARKLAGTKTQIPSGIALLEAYREKESAKGKLTRGGPFKTFFVKGKVRTHEFFYKRTGVKGQRGDRHHKDYHPEYTFTQEIQARSAADARKRFTEMANSGFNGDQCEMESIVENVKVESVSEKGDHDGGHQADQAMASARPTKYHTFRR